MIRFETSSLRSKVARRIFWVFLSCALLPCAGLIVVSYLQIENFFFDKSERQLRDLAKLFGLDVHERLTLLDESLKIVASLADSTTAAMGPGNVSDRLAAQKDRWRSLTLVTDDGQYRPLMGRLDHTIHLNLQQKAHLAEGRSLLSIVPGSRENLARIYMALTASPRRANQGIVIGEINPGYLWGIGESRLLQPEIQYCVRDQAGITLNCPEKIAKTLPRALIATSASGGYEWRHNGQNYLASYWSIPMRYYFQVPGWTIVLQTSREGSFATIADLKNTFVLAILATVSLSVLLVFIQIRKRLVPVEKLKEGTDRIAEKDFRFRVEVQSGDEFQELGDSINRMAAQLGRHFQTLSTKAEIDRVVLSLLNTERIIETILQRSIVLVPCDAVRLTLFSSDPKKTKRLFILDSRSGNGVERFDLAEPSHLPPSALEAVDGNGGAVTNQDPEMLRVLESRRPILLGESEIAALPIPHADKSQIRAIMAATLYIKDDLLGVLAFHSETAARFGTEDAEFLEGLTSQAAIAIYNSQLFERTTHHAKELEKANQAKDEFLSVMSHELRTPLNVIMGYLTLLQEKMLGELNSEQSRALATIDRRSKELLALIDSIMQATFIQTGQISFNKQSVDVAALLDSLKKRITPPADKALELNWHCDAQLPPLNTDEAKLRLILENLIDNAIKFTPEGTVALGARYEPNQRAVTFSVRDTGIGIPEQSKSSIFEIFRQIDNSGTREYSGLGLGLYIAKQFADLIGAQITVESQVAQGTTFMVRVPEGDLYNQIVGGVSGDLHFELSP